MHSFEYFCPTEIIFGQGAEGKVAEKIRNYGGNRVMILYGGGSAVKSGLLAKVKEHLKDFNLKVLGGVKPNPRLSFARNAIQEAIDAKIDFVLAVGGGSVIDTAKAIALGAANPNADIWDHWTKKINLKKSLPVGVIRAVRPRPLGRGI